eukprot:gene26475-17565_t
MLKSNVASCGMGPDPPCFCDACTEEEVSVTDMGLSLELLAVYPNYEWVPPSGNNTDAEGTTAAMEQAVHAYLQRLGRLPRPLQAGMLHQSTLKLSRRSITLFIQA